MPNCQPREQPAMPLPGEMGHHPSPKCPHLLGYAQLKLRYGEEDKLHLDIREFSLPAEKPVYCIHACLYVFPVFEGNPPVFLPVIHGLLKEITIITNHSATAHFLRLNNHVPGRGGIGEKIRQEAGPPWPFVGVTAAALPELAKQLLFQAGTGLLFPQCRGGEQAGALGLHHVLASDLLCVGLKNKAAEKKARELRFVPRDHVLKLAKTWTPFIVSV